MTAPIYSKKQYIQTVSPHTFLNHCRNIMVENDLEPPQNLMADGSLYRCGTTQKPRGKDGAYIIHLTEPYSLWWQNWHSGVSGTHTAKAEEHMPSAHRRALHERRKAEATQREQDKLSRYNEAAQRANNIWDAAIPATAEHPYLKSKGVPSLCLRVTRGGHLVIPVMNIAGKCQSLQFIPPDGKAKRFLAGGKMQDGFFHLRGNSKDTNQPLCICEGYSTAASVHMATGYVCLVAFNAGNLSAVAHMARQKYPERTIILCADNDIANATNVGIEKASAAAKEVNGLLAIPPNAEDNNVDFNDVHLAKGLNAVKECIDKACAQLWKTPMAFGESC